MHKICIIRNNNGGIWVHVTLYGALIFRFFHIVVIVLSRILLAGILQNYPCNILTLKYDIDIIFAGKV